MVFVLCFDFCFFVCFTRVEKERDDGYRGRCNLGGAEVRGNTIRIYCVGKMNKKNKGISSILHPSVSPFILLGKEMRQLYLYHG